MEKFKAFIAAVTAALSLFFGITFGDTFTPGNFPIIGPETKAEDCTRIMSFNVRCTDVGGTQMPLRVSLVIDEINEVKPDSFGVQEATGLWMLNLKTKLKDYACVGKGRDPLSTGERSAVFYLKDKFELVDSDTFWLSETPEKVSRDWDSACNRVCTWAILKNKATGEEYVHVNTHLDHQSELARVNGIKLIMNFITENFSGKNVVFTADMNSNLSGEPYQLLTTLLNDTHLTAQDIKTYGTFHGTKPERNSERYLDYVMVSDNVTPVCYRTVTSGIDGRFVSDHFPIYADVKFNTDN